MKPKVIIQNATDNLRMASQTLAQLGAIALAIRDKADKDSAAYHLACAAQYLAQNMAECVDIEAHELQRHVSADAIKEGEK